jgi:hypothetical protein
MPFMPRSWHAVRNLEFARQFIKRLRETSIIIGGDDDDKSPANENMEADKKPEATETKIIDDLKYAVEVHNTWTSNINEYARQLEAQGLHVELTPIYSGPLMSFDTSTRVYKVKLVIERRERIGP